MLRDCSSTGNESVLSDSSHNIVEKYSYDVFGKPTIRNSQGNIITTSAYGNRFMFTGREYDSESGLYYYRARNYSPWIGRFLQTDPIGYAAGLNLYTYCGNNPISWIDPLGLYGSDVHYSQTALWAYRAGFTVQQALTIASTDEGVDTGWSYPLNPFGGSQQHFRNRGKVIDNLNEAIEKGDLEAFARNLHSLQDTFSHEGYDWYKGGHLGRPNPDEYNRNSERDKLMEKWTKHFMRKWLEKNKKKGS